MGWINHMFTFMTAWFSIRGAKLQPDWTKAWSDGVNVAFRQGWVLLLILGITVTPALNLEPAWATAEPDRPTPAVVEQVDRWFQEAVAANDRGDFALAEARWTAILEQLPHNPAIWSNRGNARASQNHMTEAISDYNQAIELAPEEPDAYLNRGVAWERLEHWEAAIANYNQVITLDPQDAAAYNNRGNAYAGQRRWDAALADYQKATELAPGFAFARANYALALYQTGEQRIALDLIRALIRKYPQFADMRAALTAILWTQGHQNEAESNWAAVTGLDPRYQDLEWVTQIRRWPPAMVSALQHFLALE
jgi:tetratricopeptide (TPR) repeat protein